MEHIRMTYLKDLIHRIRSGEGDRHIAQDMRISRATVRKYCLRAEQRESLGPDVSLPSDAFLAAAPGQIPSPPQVESSLEPCREAVEHLLDQGVDMTAIYQRPQEDYGYKRSYPPRGDPFTGQVLRSRR